MPALLTIAPTFSFREESFGGIGFFRVFSKHWQRQYYYLDSNAFLLFQYLDENPGLSMDELLAVVPEELVEPVQEQLTDWLKEGILTTTDQLANYTSRLRQSQVTRSDILSGPVEVNYFATSACTQRCEFCSAGQHLHQVNDEMQPADIDRLLQTLRQIGPFKFYFVGGEPTLCRHLEYFVDGLNQLGMDVGLSTNGTGCSVERLEWLMQQGVDITFSLLSSQPVIHDAMVRRPGAFDQIWSSIQTLKRKDYRIEVSSVMTNRNFHSLPEYVHFLGKAGVDSLILLHAFPLGYMRTRLSDIPDRPTFMEHTRQAAAIAEEYGMKFRALCRFDFVFTGEPLAEENELTPYFGRQKGCSAGLRHVTLFPSGDLYPCDFLTDTNWRLGNILHDDFKTIWDHSSLLETFRQLQSPVECSNCRFQEICFGGCPAVTYLNGEGLSLPNPQCPILGNEP